MKLREPGKIAFESGNDTVMDFDEARDSRSREFWKPLTDVFQVRDAHSDRPFKEEEHCPVCATTVRGTLKKMILDALNRLSGDISEEKCYNLPTGLDSREFWETVKFILAFDTSFTYFIDIDGGDGEEPDSEAETDYLDEETAFRFDVVQACDRLALQGAAFSKRFGSDAYRLWADAMIKLGNEYEEVQYKAADDIVAALAQTWADLRTWIFLKDAHKRQKSKSWSEKTKK